MTVDPARVEPIEGPAVAGARAAIVYRPTATLRCANLIPRWRLHRGLPASTTSLSRSTTELRLSTVPGHARRLRAQHYLYRPVCDGVRTSATDAVRSHMKRRVVTVRDVAKLAGVHPATVSRALNPAQRRRLTEKTVTRVEQAARELGYRANSIAQGLRTRRSLTVGVMIPDLTNAIFPPLIRGIEDYLHPLGLTALLTNTDAEPERELRGLKALAARQVDGFIVAPTNSSLDLVKEIIDDNVPVVLVNRSIEGVRGHAVTPDDRRGAASAVQHLITLGHRAISHIAGPPNISPSEERFRGFVEGMRQLGFEPSTKLVTHAAAFTGGAGVAPTRKLLECGEDFTAVFAANDLLALDCIDTLKAAGRSCPGDVSVVGFNDMPFTERFTPPLTTIRFSHYEVGRRAAEMLIDQIDRDHSEQRTVVLSTELIERGSTAPPRHPQRAYADARKS
jgi:LacI family transcriptional regulator, galactose operon repressor